MKVIISKAQQELIDVIVGAAACNERIRELLYSEDLQLERMGLWFLLQENFPSNNDTEQVNKTLDNVDITDVKQKIPDVKVIGDGNLFQLLSKASSKKEGWMKSTKAMEIEGLGCVVQVTTQQRNPDGSYVIGEALTTVLDTTIIEDLNSGRKLSSLHTEMLKQIRENKGIPDQL